MTDKVQKIREEVEMVVNRRLNLLNGDYFDLNKEAGGFTNEIMDIIDSLQEEPVSKQKLSNSFNIGKDCKEEPVNEELEKVAEEYALDDYIKPWRELVKRAFKDGVNWQKENLWKPADGDDLPEYDREVIAITDYIFGHYMVVYAHRPNPNGWDGKSVTNSKVEHYTPKTYDKGGWNTPDVKYWLDARLPYEEK